MDGAQVMSKKHCHKIDHNMENLCRLVNLDSSLWRLLVSRGIFHTSDRDIINGVSAGQMHGVRKEDAVFELLASLQKKPDICYYQFVECLKEAGQDSAPKLLIESSTKPINITSQSPMFRNPCLYRCVSKCYDLLVETLSQAPWRFYDKLVSRDIIDKEFIRQYTSAEPDLKARRLIDIICELSESQFQGFVQALEFTGKTSVAETLKRADQETRKELSIINILKAHISKHYRQITMICSAHKLDVQRVYTAPVIKCGSSDETLTHYTDMILSDSKKMLLTGRRGTGKTTLVCMLLNHWLKANEEESTYIDHRFKRFKYILPLDFSQINLHDSLPYILKTQLGLEGDTPDFLVQCFREYPDDILLIFDNVNISSIALPQFAETLQKTNTENITIIYVSRDIECKDYVYFNQRFELNGLSDEGVQQYLLKIFHLFGSKRDFISYWSRQTLEPNLMPLVRNPLHLQIVIFLWEKRGDFPFLYIFLNILQYGLFNKNCSIICTDLECKSFVREFFKFEREFEILGHAIISQITCSDELFINLDPIVLTSFYHILELLPVNIQNDRVTFTIPSFKYFLAAIHLVLSNDHDIILKLLNNVYEKNCKCSLHILEICYGLEQLTAKTQDHIHSALIRYIAEREDFWKHVEYTMTWSICFPHFEEVWPDTSLLENLQRQIDCLEERFISSDIFETAIVDVKEKITITLLYFKDIVGKQPVREIKLKSMSDFALNCWLLSLWCFSQLEILEINCSLFSFRYSDLLANTLCLLDKLKSLKLVGLIYTKEHNVIANIARLQNLEYVNLEAVKGGEYCSKTIGMALLDLTKLVSIHFSFSETLAAEETAGLLHSISECVEPRITEMSFENIVMDSDVLIMFDRLIVYLKNLNNLSIGKCEFHELNKRRFFGVVGKAISLTSLKLREICLSDEDVKAFLEALSILKELQKLVLINLKFFSNLSCKEFSQGLRILRHLFGLTLITQSKSHTGICNFLVSKNLEELSISNSICEIPPSFFKRLSTFSYLHTLSLIYCNLGSVGFMRLKEALINLPYLTYLNLSHCGGSDIVLNEDFMKNLRINSRLKVFNVSGNKSDSRGFRLLAIVLPLYTKLVELDLGDCGCTDPEVMTSLIDSIAKLTCLEILNLSGNRINKEGFTNLSAAFQRISKLRFLSLNECVGQNETSSGLDMSNLGEIPNLEQLHLSKTWVGEDEATILPEKLLKLKHLKVLDLSHCRNHNINSITKVLNSLKRFLFLESLFLDGMVIGNQAYSELTSVIRHLKFLKHLSMNYCACTDGVISNEFMTVLGRCYDLESISLCGTSISKSSMDTLAESVVMLRNLSKINLRECKCKYPGAMETFCLNLYYTSVEELQLSSNLLSVKGFNALVNVLPGFRSLRLLSLDNCGCRNPFAFAALVDCLTEVNSLQHLDLSCNTAGKEGTKSLINIIPRLPCLIVLNISKTYLVCDEELFRSLGLCSLLEKLDLSGNVFPSNGFERLAAHIQHLRHLEYISLKECVHARKNLIQYFKMCNVKTIRFN